MLGSALALLGFAVAQAAPPTLVPIYEAPTRFNPQQGERMRLGALGGSSADVAALLQLGVDYIFDRTDDLGPPEGGKGSRSLASLAAKHKVARDSDLAFGLTVYTTFPALDQQAIVGDGVLNVADGSRMPAWSPWNPQRIPWSAERMGYVNRALPSLDALTVGVFGEYGDAALFTGTARRNPEVEKLWEDRLRAAPPAPGFWSGDPLAQAHWESALLSAFDTLEDAYRSWGMEPPNPVLLPTPISPDFPYAARAQYMDWYRGAVPRLIRGLVGIANEIFPSTNLLVPIGPPSDQPYLGLDIYRAASAAKEADAIKVTNVGFYDFAADWAMSLGRIRGAARTVGAAIWSEAPNAGESAKFDQRLFEAISLGSRGHIELAASLTERSQELARLLPDLTVGEVNCDVAVIYPSTAHGLRPAQAAPPLLYRSLLELRDYLDFDVLEESAISAGALKNYRVAVLLEGSVWEPRTLEAMKEWVEAGGTLSAYDFGRMADTKGNTHVHAALFGFGSQFDRASVSTKWVGEVPPTYALSFGGQTDEEFLLGRWGASSGGSRPAFNGAQLRLPAPNEGDVAVTLLFDPGTQSDTKLTLSVDARPTATITFDGGLSRCQLVIDRGRLQGDTFRIGFGGMGAEQSVRVLGAIVTNGDADGPPAKLTGFFEAPPDSDLAKKWSKKLGDGMLLYFPGQRDLWKQYVAVVRVLAYHLSDLKPGAKDARAMDDRHDGVYMTDLGSRIAVYNGSALPAVRSFVLGDSRRSVEVPAGRLVVVGRPEPTRIVLTFEARTTGFDPADRAGVVVPNGLALEAKVTIDRAGMYSIFARTLREGRLWAPKIEVGSAQIGPVSMPKRGDYYLIGRFELPAGETAVKFHGTGGHVAEGLVVTDEESIASFRIAR